MRSCSCCFCVLSTFARFSMARFSHQREKRIPPTTNTTTTRAAEVYSVGFLKKGLDCISGSAGMVTPRMKQLPLKKYRDAGLQIFEGGLVEIGPLVRCDAGSDRNCMVDYDIGGAQTFFQIGTFRKPVAGNENRKLVIVSDSNDNFEK